MAETIISQTDIDALADRLLSRAQSRLMHNQPALQADLRLAALLLNRIVLPLVVAAGKPLEIEE
jgi:hypothetical protein